MAAKKPITAPALTSTEYICRTKCWFQTKLWNIGDILVSGLPVKEIPPHFEAAKQEEVKPVPVLPKDAKALSQAMTEDFLG